MNITRVGIGWTAGVAGLMLVALSAQAADFCCTCRGQTTGKTLSAADELSASFDCTLACKRPTRPKPGACEAAPASPAAAPAAAAPAPPTVATTVLLYTSEDCTGDAKSVSASTPKLADQGIAGIRSFSVASGLPAAAFETAGYAGASTQPVGATLCVSPGWEVAGIRLQGQ